MTRSAENQPRRSTATTSNSGPGPAVRRRSALRCSGGLVPLAGVAGGHAAAQAGDVRIALRHLVRIAEVEHRGALLRAVLAVVIGAEQAVPEEAGDAVIAVLVVEM